MSEVTTRELLERWAHGLCAQWARNVASVPSDAARLAASVPSDAAHLIGKLLKRAFIEGAKQGVHRCAWTANRRSSGGISGDTLDAAVVAAERELAELLFGPDVPRADAPLSPDEFAAAVAECGKYGPEEGHVKADELLCEQLRRLGYGEGVKEFEQLHKWYA